jgi:hypothetical protein
VRLSEITNALTYYVPEASTIKFITTTIDYVAYQACGFVIIIIYKHGLRWK